MTVYLGLCIFFVSVWGGVGLNESKKYARPGTEAVRTKIQPSKPKQEITKITNSQNTKRTYGKPIEHLFPRSWPLNNPDRTKII